MADFMTVVTIERDDCISCAQCWTRCPEFFEESPEDGRSMVAEMYRVEGKLNKGSAPDSFEECLREAEEACPAEVIMVTRPRKSFD
jgi:ferredoxin